MAVGTAEGRAAIFNRELDLEHLMTTAVERRRSPRARFSLRTDGMLVFPIHDKLTDIEPLFSIRLPFDIDGCRANDLNPETLLTAYRHLRGHILHRASAVVGQYPLGEVLPERTGTPFNHLEFPTDIVLLAVVWRLRYKLSLRDVAKMFLARGFAFTHEAIRDWETRFTSLLTDQSCLK